jgi:hypothetical protein
MNINLKAKLYKALNDWMDNNCDTEDWTEAFMGNETADLMAESASSVFDAVV